MSRLLLVFSWRPHSEQRYCFRWFLGFGNFILIANGSDDTAGPFLEKSHSADSDCFGMLLLFVESFFLRRPDDSSILDAEFCDLYSLADSKVLVCFDALFDMPRLECTERFFFRLLHRERQFFDDVFSLATEYSAFSSVVSTSRQTDK